MRQPADKRMTYRVDELLRIRETDHETVKALQKIIESECGGHLLHGSIGSNDQSSRYRSSPMNRRSYEDRSSDQAPSRASNSTRVRPIKGNRWSPTPSLRKGKAAQLLKEHGSPPGVRVTAGGRIVPDALPSLTSPKHSPDTGLGAPSFNIELGPYYTQIMPDVQMPGMTTGLPFYEAPSTHEKPASASLDKPDPITRDGPSRGPRTSSQRGSHHNQNEASYAVRALDDEYAALQQDLKNLNRDEVLQRASMTAAKRQSIVRTRILLTQRLDQCRRAMDAAKRTKTPVPGIVMHPAFGWDPSMMHMYPVYAVPASQAYSQLGLHEAKSANPTTSHLQPDCEEFVPQHFRPEASRSDEANGTTLRELSVNTGAGTTLAGSSHQTAPLPTSDSATPKMGQNASSATEDPSRRTSAIAIKRPDWNAVSPVLAKYRSKENVAAPETHTDSSKISGVDESDVTASPVSPRPLSPAKHAIVRSPGGKRHCSSSSVNTVDFFPRDALEHSAQPGQHGQRTRPGFAPVMGGTEIPPGVTKSQLSPISLFSDSPVFPVRHVTSEDLTAHRLAERLSPVNNLTSPFTDGMRDDESRLLPSPSAEVNGIESYRQGFNSALHRSIKLAMGSMDFRAGYCDGLLYSFANKAAVTTQPHDVFPSTPDVFKRKPNHYQPVVDRLRRSTSLPCFRQSLDDLLYWPRRVKLEEKYASSTAGRLHAQVSGQNGRVPAVLQYVGRPSGARTDQIMSPRYGALLQKLVWQNAIGHAGHRNLNSRLDGTILEHREEDKTLTLQKAIATAASDPLNARGVMNARNDHSSPLEKMTESILSTPTSPKSMSQQHAFTKYSDRDTSPTKMIISNAMASMRQIVGLDQKRNGSTAANKQNATASQDPVLHKRQWRDRLTRNLKKA